MTQEMTQETWEMGRGGSAPPHRPPQVPGPRLRRRILTSEVRLNLLPGSIFVLVVILLVVLVLHALAVITAPACRLAFGGNGYNCFAPATSRLAKSFSWPLLTTRLVRRLACRSNQGLRSEGQAASTVLDSESTVLSRGGKFVLDTAPGTRS